MQRSNSSPYAHSSVDTLPLSASHRSSNSSGVLVVGVNKSAEVRRSQEAIRQILTGSRGPFPQMVLPPGGGFWMDGVNMNMNGCWTTTTMMSCGGGGEEDEAAAAATELLEMHNNNDNDSDHNDSGDDELCPEGGYHHEHEAVPLPLNANSSCVRLKLETNDKAICYRRHFFGRVCSFVFCTNK